MFVVDTNIFVYAADRSFTEYARCRDLVEDWRHGTQPWYTTWGILYEFLRVVTHPRVIQKPVSVSDAWRIVESLLASRSLGLLTHTPNHAEIARQTIAELPTIKGNILHDFHTAIIMREHGVLRIVTRDTDFHRFPFLEVIDPLANN